MRSIDAASFEPSLEWFDGHYGSSPVAVFDFDGVLSSPVEDLVYKLPEEAGERGALTRLAETHGIAPDLYDTAYLRHLVLQAVLEGERVQPAAGPLLRLASELSSSGRAFFILTARSGLAAVERMLGFVRVHGLQPQEVFCVGRVAKGRQLSVVRNAVPDRCGIVYFEDTARHVRNSNLQDFEGFSTVRIVWNRSPWMEAERMRAALLADASLVRSVRTAA